MVVRVAGALWGILAVNAVLETGDGRGRLADMSNSDVTGWVAILIALLALWVSIWQPRYITRVQVLLQLDSTWTSEAMCRTRRKAATALVNAKPTADVDRVLDFFETIAGLFVQRHWWWPLSSRVLPDSWASHTFFWHAACYWSSSRDYIEEVRQRSTERESWEDLCELIPRWIKKHGAPTPKDIEAFLEDEKKL